MKKKMYNEMHENCNKCHGPLTPEISQTVIYHTDDLELTIKNEPHLECKKCRRYYSSEPYQSQKIDIFKDFIKTIPFKKVEIEYKDLIEYVDNNLLDDEAN